MVTARNFEAHGTSKCAELRSAWNFEEHGTSQFVCILLYLNPYYSRTNLKLKKMRAELANLNNCAVPFLSRAAVKLSWYDIILHALDPKA